MSEKTIDKESQTKEDPRTLNLKELYKTSHTKSKDNKDYLKKRLDEILSEWKCYKKDILTENGLILDKYTNLKSEDKYLTDFIEKRTNDVFGGIKGSFSNNYMVYRRNDSSKEVYYVDKHDKEECPKEKAEKYYNENIRPLLKHIIEKIQLDNSSKDPFKDLNNKLGLLYEFLNNKEEQVGKLYDKYFGKILLNKMILIDTLSQIKDITDNKNSKINLGEFPNILAGVWKEDALNYLYNQYIDDDNPESKNVLQKNAAIQRFFYSEIIKEKEESLLEWNNFIIVLSKIGDFMWELWNFSPEFGKNKPNIIYYGAPGTGKTFKARKSILWELRKKKLDERINFKQIQVHPGFGYADFIEGIKPVGTNTNGGIVFEVVNGVFKDFCIKAKSKPKEYFYFLIDEINRTDLSSLFGETLSLIEKSYRDNPNSSYDKRNLVDTPLSTLINKEIEKAIESNDQKVLEKAKKLAYDYNEETGEVKFGIPENIYIIGTMNNVDKSIDSFDLALRRRFKWVRKGFDEDVLENFLNENNIEVNSAKTFVNNCIELNKYIVKELRLGYDYQIGHSYFMKIVDEVNRNKKIKSDNCKSLFDSYLEPLLTEYLRGIKEEKDIYEEIKKMRDKFVKMSSNG